MARERLVEEIRRVAAGIAASHGVEIVDLIFRLQGKHSVVRVDIDRPGIPGVGIADCEAVSRDLETALDATDGLPEAYDLQVSSPGLDRPIRTDDDFRRNTGRRVVVETGDSVVGARHIVGTLESATASVIRLRLDDGEDIEIQRQSIVFARQDLGLGPERPSRQGRPGPPGPHGIV
jgi:ribosome maturation factor RimP